MILSVPPMESKGKAWPSLGPQVCEWIEDNLVHGPGDLLGRPVRLDSEKIALIGRMYEVYPSQHEKAGRRRFKRACLSVRKGWAKTELAAMLAAAELHPDAPVRVDGWGKKGQPIGAGVTDPYIPLVAYTEEQSDELAYHALYVILNESKEIRDHFDIGLERILRKDGNGRAVSLASSPGGNDGARTTFQLFDETHRFTTPRLIKAHQTMLANIPKRYKADAWSLETTTSYSPGEGSVAESTMKYAKAVLSGAIKDSKLFFFHRQASESIELFDAQGALIPKNVRAATIEASGPVSAWSDVDSIVDQFQDPEADLAYLIRVWHNRPHQSNDRAFSVELFESLGNGGAKIPKGADIALGFDGSRTNDSTALVATEIMTGLQVLIGLWERPENADESWAVPVGEVASAVELAFDTWTVWRMYADPPYWEEQVASWAGRFGEKRVIQWRTNHWAKMGGAVRTFGNALKSRELSHDGNRAYIRHVGNCHKMKTSVRDDRGEYLSVLVKEAKGSSLKIDAAVAGVLSWQARIDAISEGVGHKPKSVYENRGVLWV